MSEIGPADWRNETSGVLRPVIEAYLRGQPMTAIGIAAMRAYLRQWIMAPVWDRNPSAVFRAVLVDLRRRVDQLNDVETIEDWLDDALEAELDPL